uniref:non-specific serine/threonine protein kinase n=1 Tax=Trichuris muris TaxID=70415 RepID=A0A5S6Q4J9_TRIMR
MKLLNAATLNKRTVPFTDDWDVVRTLGEGSFGEVKLLVHRQQHNSIAVKIMCFDGRENRMDAAKREACVLKSLKHPNIISSIGYRIERNSLYLFLEYASEGELYDRIEPDVGMPEHQAQYFLSSADCRSGCKGVTHRDLKPENLLIADNELLKISDFGMATIFRNKRGIERMLVTRCGTLPYAAPEVLLGPYRAQPVDMWSCGVILMAMWSKTADCNATPWQRIPKIPLSLLTSLLNCDPVVRITVECVKKHEWFTQDLADEDATQVRSHCNMSRHLEGFGGSKGNADHAQAVYMSQPPQCTREKRHSSGSNLEPTNLDNLLLSTQTSSQSSKISLEKLVKRMTRLFFHVGLTESLAKVEEACILMGMQPTCCANQITVCTVDSRRNTLIFKVAAYEMNNSILLDFRLSKGDGLDFKRTFLKLKTLLSAHISQMQDPNLPCGSHSSAAAVASR